MSFTFPLLPLFLLLSTLMLPFLSPHLVNITQRLNKEEVLLLRPLLPSLLLNTNPTLHLQLISVKVKDHRTLLLLEQEDLKLRVTPTTLLNKEDKVREVRMDLDSESQLELMVHLNLLLKIKEDSVSTLNNNSNNRPLTAVCPTLHSLLQVETILD